MENNNDNQLNKRVSDLEATVNKMGATCCLQHPVNLSEKITVCEVKIKNLSDSLNALDNRVHQDIEAVKDSISKIKDGHSDDVDKLKDRFDKRIDDVDAKFINVENEIRELTGKINTTNLILTDMTNAKIKKNDNMSSLWVLIIGTVISSLVVGMITYFLFVHDAYQQHKYHENYINNSGNRQVIHNSGGK